ncbi:MAG: universal stress protein [Salinarchaeum sp.]
MFDRILIPTDGSEPAEHAIPTGIDLAAAHDATVYAIYVVEPVPLGGYAAGMSAASSEHSAYTEQQEEEAEAALDIVSNAGREADVDVVETIKYGEPDEAIVTYAETNDIDLIVMGTHGRSGADRLVIGSVAEKVVRGSSVPVLTVGPEESYS